MKKEILIGCTATEAKIFTPDKGAKKIISDMVSYTVDNHVWTGVHSMFNWADSSFPAGFIRDAYKALEDAGYKPIIYREKAPEPLGPPVLQCKVNDFGFTPEYWYQPYTITQLMKHRQIIAQVATGGGKTEICKLAYAHIGRKAIFLTSRKSLLHQMKESVELDMGETVGQVGDGEYNIIDGFNVGMIKTFAEAIIELHPEDRGKDKGEFTKHLDLIDRNEQAKVDAMVRGLPKGTSANERKAKIAALRGKLNQEREDDSIVEARINAKIAKHNKRRLEVLADLADFELIIMEEAHESAGNGYFNVMNACVNGVYRLALTATPFMGEEQERNFRLLATAGKIAVQITERELIDAGILATPYFCYYSTPEPTLGIRGASYRVAYPKLIVDNPGRNKMAVEQALLAASVGQSTLILVKETKHGKLVADMISAMDPSQEVNFISGEHNNEKRKQVLASLNRAGIVIATKILDVGVDVPSVGFLILLGGDKGEVSLRQRIGRVLRRKKLGPNICFVMDFRDEHNKHIRGHSNQRKKIINSIDGFKQQLLPDDTCFNWDSFRKMGTLS